MNWRTTEILLKSILLVGKASRTFYCCLSTDPGTVWAPGKLSEARWLPQAQCPKSAQWPDIWVPPSIPPVKTRASLLRGEGGARPRHKPGKLSTQESGEVTGASLSPLGWREEGDKHKRLWSLLPLVTPIWAVFLWERELNSSLCPSMDVDKSLPSSELLLPPLWWSGGKEVLFNPWHPETRLKGGDHLTDWSSVIENSGSPIPGFRL